jgi:hypothetical protein
MEDKKSQKVCEQAEDDSSSLYVLCDSAPFITNQTTTTGAYKRTFRSLMRRTAARQRRDDGDSNRPMPAKPPKPSQAEIDQAKRSAAIDRKLEEDSRREVKILALGEGAATLIKQMKTTHQNGYTQEERMLYRPCVNRYLLSTLQSAMGMAAATEVGSTVSIEF